MAAAKIKVTLLKCKSKEHVQSDSLVVQNPVEPRLPALVFYPERHQKKQVERRTTRFWTGKKNILGNMGYHILEMFIRKSKLSIACCYRKID